MALTEGARRGRALVVRLDSAGDVLLAGPAVRSVAARRGRVTMLTSPLGEAAAHLLPGVDEVMVWSAPWVLADAPPVRPAALSELVDRLAAGGFDDALVLTSFHQSPLPTALVLRLAGVGRIAAISVDYPGSLLDVRHGVDDDIPEPERALSLAAAAGFPLPPGDGGDLAVRRPLPDTGHLTGPGPYVVVHPGAAAPARRWPPERCAEAVAELARRGRRVVVTGAPSERGLTAFVAGRDGLDLGGRTGLAGLASVLAGADALVVGNTGPAHLAAAVGTPVVSLYSPVVPAVRWAPYGVPHVLLGDQLAPCRDTRARECPVPGHPCLSRVAADEVAEAVDMLTAHVLEKGDAR
ncbi:glycosyltransferase family 9 protein [Thermomonospora umbrina]|uniref:ADP-heptose:LPS heptosyltransferase n=1 Tax=Thermomonospora umbrina TaxID=111806 RepID=A0A3D9SYQ3_9ACTN|nr:glycosyltransferase family 9 protein [Thermomonospora umbrina]REF01077.1 ADP-heptose:LPS heptosyltransferase [Thermomonospora umbrina]